MMMSWQRWHLMTSPCFKRRNTVILLSLTTFFSIYALYGNNNSSFVRVLGSPENVVWIQQGSREESGLGAKRIILGQSNNMTPVNKDPSSYFDFQPGDKQEVEDQSTSQLLCTNDDSQLKFIENLRIEPPSSRVRPEFSSRITYYEVTVDYPQLTVNMAAVSAHCDVTVLYGPDYISAQSVNVTVGIGENRFKILVVKEDKTRTRQPWLLNTYTVVIRRRQQRQLRHLDRAQLANLRVCHIHQTCDLVMYPSIPCGLQPSSKFESWRDFQRFTRRLPTCSSHQQGTGKWHVPCETCSADNLWCAWSEATWQPGHCRTARLDKSALSRCLEDTKVLFIGDSTNRGMMYYLVERVNGTLASWDKTHGTNIMADVNDKSTDLAFTYYPQFWLPTDSRPMFDKAVYQLLHRVGPLHNDSRTVFVIGGVQWLSVNHLYTLHNILKEEGLSAAKVIVKTIGAGFNQEVDNVHHLTLTEQRKFFKHNEELKTFAWHYGMDVIDTLNITFARYQHFYAGKCGCHFHQVRQSRKQPGKYHVEGDVNAQYTELLINSLCDHHK